MGDKSKIQWTDATWTPIRARNISTGKVGWHCEHVTPGCEECYSESMNKRLGTGLPFKPGYRADIEIFLDEKMLLAPLRWNKPRMIFVCSMTDLFAEFVSDEMIDRVFAVMALAPRHTFQVLSKRSSRMREYINGPWSNLDGVAARIADATWQFAPRRVQLPDDPVIINEIPVGPRLPSGEPEFGFRRMLRVNAWPLRNVWLGVSAEDQRRADERVPDLLATPAAVRFVSAEPLLGPIDFSSAAGPYQPFRTIWWDTKTRGGRPPQPGGIDWIITGGESGRGARPAAFDWYRGIRDQCAAARVAYFHKQHGEFVPATDPYDGLPRDKTTGSPMVRVGKKRAGRLLDGALHDGYPEPHRP